MATCRGCCCTCCTVFVAALGVLVVLFVAPSLLTPPTADPTFGIHAVTDTSARIWARVPLAIPDGSAAVRVDLRQCGSAPSGAPALSVSQDITAVSRIVLLAVDGMEPETCYRGDIVVSAAEGRATPPRSLIPKQDLDLGLVGSFSATTLPPPGKGPTQLSFIFSTCMMPFPFVPYRVFDHWRALEPDLAFILGDLVYNDASVEAVGSLLARVFSIPQLRALVQHVPLYFTWDDHEVVDDFDQVSTPEGAELYALTFEPYQMWVSQRNPPTPDGNDLGIYYTLHYGEVSFFVLDTRTFRDPNFSPDGSGKTMIGTQQKAALKEWLLDPRFKFKCIMSSSLFSEYVSVVGDGWRHFVDERDEILAFVEDNNVTGAVVFSGDIHLAATTAVALPGTSGGEVLEFSASPIMAPPLRPVIRDGPRRARESVLNIQSLGFHFGRVQIDTSDPPTLEYTLYRAEIWSPTTFVPVWNHTVALAP